MASNDDDSTSPLTCFDINQISENAISLCQGCSNWDGSHIVKRFIGKDRNNCCKTRYGCTQIVDVDNQDSIVQTASQNNNQIKTTGQTSVCSRLRSKRKKDFTSVTNQDSATDPSEGEEDDDQQGQELSVDATSNGIKRINCARCSFLHASRIELLEKIESLKRENLQMKNTIKLKERELILCQQKIRDSEAEVSFLLDDATVDVELESDIESRLKLIESELFGKGYTLENRAMRLAKVLLKNNVFGGLVPKYCLWIAPSPYTAERVLKAIDLHGGILNYKGYEALRSIESSTIFNCPNNNILPHYHRVKTLSKKINDIADNIIPFTSQVNNDIDIVSFDFKKMLLYLIKIHGLSEICKERSIEVAITIDGAKLTKRVSHMMAGIKIIDRDAKDPISGESLISFVTESDGTIKYKSGSHQSRTNCYPFLILIGKECNKTYDNKYVEDFFRFFKDVEENGLDDSLPLKVSAPQDMASLQKTLGRGGSSGTKNYFCHCCGIHKDYKAKHNIIKCDRCIKLNNEYCYHHRVSDAKTKDFYRQEIMNYEEKFSYLKYIHQKNTVMVYDPQDLNKTGNILNIEYQAPNLKSMGEFLSMVNNELIMRGIDISLPLTVRLENLKQYLIMENEIEKMKAVLENRNRLQIQKTPYISLEQAIICILHLVNRVGETLLKFLLTNSLEAITNDTHMT